MANARSKQSVPVLAYLTSQPLSTLCSMRLFYKDDKQLSVAIYFPVALHGAKEEQMFVLQYDADNQRARSPSALNSASVHIPKDRLDELARNAEFEITTLTLYLKQPAPVWCPLNQVMAPQPFPASVIGFNELVELAKATTVHLVFDYKWLTGSNQAAIKRLIKGKVSLNGFSLNKYFIKGWELKDWTYFAPASDPATVPATALATPPAVQSEASIKRGRPGSSSISPSPPAKRLLIDDPNAPSPTEVASSPPVYSKPESDTDFQTQAIRHAVVRELPALLAAALPPALAALLPPALPAIFAVPNQHMDSFDSDDSMFPDLQLTPAGAAFVPYLLAHLKPQIQDILDRSLSHTRTQRENAELAFEEDVDNKKLELHEITERGKMDLERVIAHKTDDFKHHLRDDGENIAIYIEDEVRQAADNVYEHTLQRLKELDSRTLGKLVEWEVARQLGRSVFHAESRLRGVRTGKGGCRALGRRKRTFPMSLGAWQSDHRLAESKLAKLLWTGFPHPYA